MFCFKLKRWDVVPGPRSHTQIRSFFHVDGDFTLSANMLACLARECTGGSFEPARERIAPSPGDARPALRASTANTTCTADHFIFPGMSASDELGL